MQERKNNPSLERQIFINCETTGLWLEQDRIVEISCLVFQNGQPTGASLCASINPERACDAAATEVHGHSDAFLATQPVFADVAPDFLNYIQGAELVMYNAAFDCAFLNAELERLTLPQGQSCIEDYAGDIKDTQKLARAIFPNSKSSMTEIAARLGLQAETSPMPREIDLVQLQANIYMALQAIDLVQNVQSTALQATGGAGSGHIIFASLDALGDVPTCHFAKTQKGRHPQTIIPAQISNDPAMLVIQDAATAHYLHNQTALWQQLQQLTQSTTLHDLIRAKCPNHTPRFPTTTEMPNPALCAAQAYHSYLNKVPEKADWAKFLALELADLKKLTKTISLLGEVVFYTDQKIRSDEYVSEYSAQYRFDSMLWGKHRSWLGKMLSEAVVRILSMRQITANHDGEELAQSGILRFDKKKIWLEWVGSATIAALQKNYLHQEGNNE
jgi:DNA polymerase III subunit epsilon